MFLRSGEEKVRLLLNLDSLLDLHVLFLTKYVSVKWNKAEPVKWGKCGFSSCLQNSQQPVSPNWVFRWVRGSHGDCFPRLDTWVDCFVSDLSHASFLLIFYVMHLLSLVMLGCVGWVNSGKEKGKTGQKASTGWGTWGGESRADPHMQGCGIPASPQWLANEWMDLWKRDYRKDRGKLFSEVHYKWTRATGYKLQQKDFWLYIRKKKLCECFEVLKQGPRQVWLSILGAFEIWLQKALSSLIFLWS